MESDLNHSLVFQNIIIEFLVKEGVFQKMEGLL
jgi:hypothetical protein